MNKFSNSSMGNNMDCFIGLLLNSFSANQVISSILSDANKPHSIKSTLESLCL